MIERIHAVKFESQSWISLIVIGASNPKQTIHKNKEISPNYYYLVVVVLRVVANVVVGRGLPLVGAGGSIGGRTSGLFPSQPIMLPGVDPSDTVPPQATYKSF